MCPNIHTRWSHGITDAEIRALSARKQAEGGSGPRFAAFLEAVGEAFLEDGLRPPVSVLTIVGEQLFARDRGERSELGESIVPGARVFSYSGYRYRGAGRAMAAIARFETPVQAAIHDDLPRMLMSGRVTRTVNALLDAHVGLQIVACNCCGISCVRLDEVNAFLGSPCLAQIEDARVRGVGIETVSLACISEMPADVPEFGPQDRALHERLAEVMTALCGPVAWANEPVRRPALALVA